MLDKFRPRGETLTLDAISISAKPASIPYLWTLDQSIDPSVKRQNCLHEFHTPVLFHFPRLLVLRYGVFSFLLSRFTFPESYENLGACKRRQERNPRESERETKRWWKFSSPNPQANFQSNRTTTDCPSYIVRGRHSRNISNRTLFRSCSSLLPPALPYLATIPKAHYSPPPSNTPRRTPAKRKPLKPKRRGGTVKSHVAEPRSQVFALPASSPFLHYGYSPFFSSSTPGLTLPSTPQTSDLGPGTTDTDYYLQATYTTDTLAGLTLPYTLTLTQHFRKTSTRKEKEKKEIGHSPDQRLRFPSTEYSIPASATTLNVSLFIHQSQSLVLLSAVSVSTVKVLGLDC